MFWRPYSHFSISFPDHPAIDTSSLWKTHSDSLDRTELAICGDRVTDPARFALPCRNQAVHLANADAELARGLFSAVENAM